jgi:peroxiredoxin Q/BCP
MVLLGLEHILHLLLTIAFAAAAVLALTSPAETPQQRRGRTLALCLLGALLAALLALPASATAAELKVGDAAPPFTLQGTDGKSYSLADFHGKQTVVLAWYPKAYTSGCTIECKSLAQHGDLIRAYDVVYFMASVDPLDKNKGFADEQKADFPLLSDPTKDTARAYGVLNMMGVASRNTFYIGADGKILAIDRNVNPASAAQDIAATLGKLGVAKRSE